MKRWKTIQIFLFTVICILLNVGGSRIAAVGNLPVWMDTFGTVLAAYTGGPFCGAVVGAAGNLIFGIWSFESIFYALTSIMIGVLVGVCSKKGYLEYPFGALSTSVAVTFGSLIVSAPLNLILYGGGTGNLWGDGVTGFLTERGVPYPLPGIIGQFYVEFLDKVATLLIFCIFLHFVRFLKRRGIIPFKKKPGGISAALVFFAAAACALCLPARVSASDAVAEPIDLNGYVQTVYSNDSGLPPGTANDIVQTGDGILWIGTYAGLYRYNGREFRWMDNFSSVHNVNCLYVDNEGRMWIGTNDKGLSLCINDNITNVVDTSSGLPSNSVRCVTRSADGDYYVGTTGELQLLTLQGGLNLTGQIPEIRSAVSISANDFGHVAAVDADGTLFILKDGAIQKQLSPGGEKEIFTCVQFREDGRMYAGTSDARVLVYDLTQNGFAPRASYECGEPAKVNSIYFDNRGDAFVCADDGIGYLDRKGVWHGIKTRSFNNSIDNMEIDYQGNLWFTSSRQGLLRLSESPFANVFSAAGMEPEVVNTVEQWDGYFYFGADSGLRIVDENEHTRIQNDLTKQLEGVRIRCIRKDTDNNLWLCTYGHGLIEVEPGGKQHVYDSGNGPVGDRVRVVIPLKDGGVAVSGNTGVFVIRERKVAESYLYGEELANSVALSLLETPEGDLLVGTDGDGLAKISGGKVAWQRGMSSGLPSGIVLRTVAAGNNRGYYIVTSNSLCYMGGDERIRELDRFPYFNNYDVFVRDDGKLFVLGSAGIYVTDEEALLSGREDVQFELLDSRRGLIDSLTANAWNYVDGENRLYMSGDTGVIRFDTGNYTSERMTFRMKISKVLLDQVENRIERDSVLSISRGTGKVEIVPEVINYTIEEPVVRYCLEGFDTTPTEVPLSALSTITYTNLPAGEYTFRMSVLDSGREHVMEETAYRFLKEKEIYDNPWFVAYMVSVAMIAAVWITWFIARMRIRRALAAQTRALERAQEQLRMGNETILAIAKTVDAKDVNTSQHSQRVSEYSVLLAEKLGMEEKERENLRKAALLHDIGKIGIPDRILNKPGRLTDEEYAIMKTHVTHGAEILKDFTLVEHAVEGALYHHERYDGRGYANGISGEDIPLYARIIGVADAFDAMTANRVYRKKLDFGYVLGEFEKGRGKQFDPVVVDALLALVDEGKISLEMIYGDSAPEVIKTEAVKAAEEHHRKRQEEEQKEQKEQPAEQQEQAEQKEGGAADEA